MPIEITDSTGRVFRFKKCPSCDAPIADDATLRTECPTCDTPYNQLTLYSIWRAARRQTDAARDASD